MRVLVTDGDNRAALAVTRSLGRAGHEVIVGEKQAPALAQTSRYCADRMVYPDPVVASDDFIAALAAAVTERRVDVVLPIADITTFLVTRSRPFFPRSCAIPFADADVVERAANKVALVRRAEELGVAVPRSVVVDEPEHIPDVDHLGFPLVIKPRQSRIRTARGWMSTGVSYARSHADLVRDLSSRLPHEFPVLLQERIVGPGVGVFAHYHEGRAVALFSHRRLRERPPWGGVSVLSESVPLCPVARDYAIELLDDLRWHGIAMVEFKRDVRDDEPRLMEINGRFWGSLQLAIDAGVDFPGLLVQSVSSGRFGPQPPYRIGVRSRWLWGDFDALLLTMLGGSGAPDDGHVRRLRALGEFLTFWDPKVYYDNPKWDDAKPWFFETYRWFRRIARDAAPARENGDASAPRTSVAVVSSIDRVGVDAGGWNALAAASDTSSVFQTHEWTRSWSTVFGDQFKPMFVTVSDPSGVKGIAPLTIGHRVGERIVRFLGDGRADYCDFLTTDDRFAALSAMFDALAGTRWDVIELNNVLSHSSTVAHVLEICRRSGYWPLVDDQFPCPTLLIEGHESDALDILNKPSLRRRQHYFEREGTLTWRHLRTAAEIEPYLDAFFAQHIARWAGTRSASLFVLPRNREFYRELTRNMAARGWLLFSVVECNGVPIAFHYGFDYDGRIIWYKPSFDPAFAAHSPGLVMLRQLIAYAIEHRKKELDFTVGDEPFKRRFTNHVRKTVQMQIRRDHARHLLELSRRKLTATMKSLSR